MIRKITALSVLLFALAGCSTQTQTKTGASAFENKITDSLVYLNVTRNNYSQLQPWKRSGISQTYGYGCAVGIDLILTSARNITSAEYIKVKHPSRTEYIQAVVKVIDYESDLCLLSIENADNRTELSPVSFHDIFEKNAELTSYWISSTPPTTGKWCRTPWRTPASRFGC